MKFSAVVLCLIPALASAFAPGVQVSMTGFGISRPARGSFFADGKLPFLKFRS